MNRNIDCSNSTRNSSNSSSNCSSSSISSNSRTSLLIYFCEIERRILIRALEWYTGSMVKDSEQY